MSSLITGVSGIAFICVALFCAFAAGIDTARKNPEAASLAIFFFVLFAMIGIVRLLVRS